MGGLGSLARWGVVLAVLVAVVSSAAVADARPSQRLKPTVKGLGSPVAGSPARFKLAVTLPSGGRIVRYTVDFGDGTRRRHGVRLPRRMTHLYARAGRYRVTLTVVGANGRRASARRFVRVGGRPQNGGPLLGPPPSGPFGSPTGPPVGPSPPPLPPPEPFAEIWADPVALAPGSAAAVETWVLSSITEIDTPIAGLPDGVTVTLDDGALEVAASVDAPQQPAVDLLVEGEGCFDLACQAIKLHVSIAITPLEAPAVWVFGFTAPSPDRLAAGDPIASGGTTLRDELLVTIGTTDVPGSRADADAVAAAAGGVVSGGVEDLGVYEIRWPESQDLSLRRSQLLAQPGVVEVADSTVGLTGVAAEPPGDWSDDGDQATWPFDQIHARQAWDTTQGSETVVGIVDGGTVYDDHEDLNVLQVVGPRRVASHATHVAGLACANANGVGVVGTSWGCPIVSGGIRSGADEDVLLAAVEVAMQPGVRVVNMSLGYPHEGPPTDRCATAAQQQALLDKANGFKRAFRRLFEGGIGRHIVWTLSAGNNCAAGVASPYGANADLPNVITVAATNSDGSLASFSNFGVGVEVAAPGGVSVEPVGNGTVGLWSTGVTRCGVFQGLCGGYATDWGTSMAAPVVAGIVALVRSAHPNYGAVEAAECVTASAGSETGLVTSASVFPAAGRVRHVAYSPATLPIVNAEAAVRCDTLDSTDPSLYLGRWRGSGLTLEVAEEPGGTLGMTNHETTHYTDSPCTDPPGLKIFTGFALDQRQWNGSVIATRPDCSSRLFYPGAATRVVRDYDGKPLLVVAWSSSSAIWRPTIGADGTSDGWATAYLRRVSDGQTAGPSRADTLTRSSGAVASGLTRAGGGGPAALAPSVEPR